MRLRVRAYCCAKFEKGLVSPLHSLYKIDGLPADDIWYFQGNACCVKMFLLHLKVEIPGFLQRCSLVSDTYKYHSGYPDFPKYGWSLFKLGIHSLLFTFGGMFKAYLTSRSLEVFPAWAEGILKPCFFYCYKFPSRKQMINGTFPRKANMAEMFCYVHLYSECFKCATDSVCVHSVSHLVILLVFFPLWVRPISQDDVCLVHISLWNYASFKLFTMLTVRLHIHKYLKLNRI